MQHNLGMNVGIQKLFNKRSLRWSDADCSPSRKSRRRIPMDGCKVLGCHQRTFIQVEILMSVAATSFVVDTQSISNCYEISVRCKLRKLKLLTWNISCMLFWFLGTNKFLLTQKNAPDGEWSTQTDEGIRLKLNEREESREMVYHLSQTKKGVSFKPDFTGFCEIGTNKYSI